MPVRRRIATSVRRVPCRTPRVYGSVWVEEIGTRHGTIADAVVDGAVDVAVVGLIVDKGIKRAHLYGS